MNALFEIDQHVQSQRNQSYLLVKDCTIIYLDTNYWLLLRNQLDETDIKKRWFLESVIQLAETRKFVFPISEVSFYEFLKQHDISSLKKTMQLVDKLSQGISIINMSERIVIETCDYFETQSNLAVSLINEKIWTKLSFVIGYNFLSFPPTENLKKTFYDYIGTINLTDVIMIMTSEGAYKPFAHKDDIEMLNEKCAEHADENKTFKALFLSEVGGLLDLHKEAIGQAMAYSFYKSSGRFPTAEEYAAVDNKKMHNFLYHAFRLDKITTQVPVFRITAELFAALRWNRDRKFKDGNDTMDILHASFALPYCDYFFTENELSTIIKQRKLDQLYECKVESKYDLVKSILEELTQANT